MPRRICIYLAEMAATDERVCAVVNDSVRSTKLKAFRSRFPKRFVNVGIAEQNMVGASAGLANGGMIPFCCGASCFLDGALHGAGESRPWLCEEQCEVVRHVEWHGIWRARSDSSLD